MPHRLPVVGPVLLLACVFAAPAAFADWPSFVGDGDRTPPKQGVELVDDLSEAVLLWELDHHMGAVAMMHRGWIPPADRVLRLPESAFQAGGAAGRLLLLVRLNDGELAGVTGFADHTTKASPIVDDRGPSDAESSPARQRRPQRTRRTAASVPATAINHAAVGEGVSVAAPKLIRPSANPSSDGGNPGSRV